jgi:hypothetical protein
VTRTTERAGLEAATRFLLAERDLDEHETDISALDERLGKILWALIGILISTSTAAVLLALNLVVAR